MGNLSKTYQNRSKAREIALEYLYQWFLLNAEACQNANDFMAEKEIDNETAKYSEVLIKGVFDNKTKIDELISSVAKNWSIERMIIIDRVILSIDTFEMFFREEVSNRVCISEAIEFAIKYSTMKSFAFVNGLLDKISKNSTNE